MTGLVHLLHVHHDKALHLRVLLFVEATVRIGRHLVLWLWSSWICSSSVLRFLWSLVPLPLGFEVVASVEGGMPGGGTSRRTRGVVGWSQ